MRGALALAIVALVCAVASPVAAQPGASDADRLARELAAAGEALRAGDYARAADLAGEVTGRTQAIEQIDRAEAWRVYGVALFFLDRHDEAEQALLRYLELEPDAHLDPALVPPEAIVFFEDVRTRHAAEIAAARPKPKRKRYLVLNVIPMAGQLQNGHRAKAWAIGGVEAALLATNLATFFIVRGWCDNPGHVCETGSGENVTDKTDEARVLRAVNATSGALLLGVYVYGVVDGLVYYYRDGRRERRERRNVSVGIVPVGDGGGVVFGARF